MSKPKSIFILFFIILLSSCAPLDKFPAIPQNSPTLIVQENQMETIQPMPTTLSENLPNTPNSPTTQWAYTYHRADGNRLVAGVGNLPEAIPVDIQLNGLPKWLVAAPYGDGSVWVVTLENGDVQAFLAKNSEISSLEIQPNTLPLGTPPILKIGGGELFLLQPPGSDTSPLTHPTPLLGWGDSIAYLTENGELSVSRESSIEKFVLNALPDARILQAETGRLLLLNQPTDRYEHAVLGDALEAGGFVILAVSPELRIVNKISVQPPDVIEGIMPIWADLNGDGQREVIVTLSNAQNGAKIVAYDETGNLAAIGDPVGQGYRWRHQLAVAPFGLQGEMELAVVRTPHIGGVVEFYQMQGDRLEIVATIPGFSTHSIGSRNLDNALAGDFDGDGFIELLLPNQAHQNLGAVQRTSQGAEVDWWLPLDGQHTSNLAAATLSNGQIALGIGTENNILRLWLP